MAHTNHQPEVTLGNGNTSRLDVLKNFSKEKLRKSTAAVLVLIGATALAACNDPAEANTPSNSPTPIESTTPSEKPSTSPTAEAEGYGPSASERDQFIESIAIPAGEDATATGKKIVENFNLWANIGATKEASERLQRESLDPSSNVINMSLQEYSDMFVADWKDEFATLFDESAASTPTNLDNFTTVAANIMAAYLGTVDNGYAQATFSVSKTFVSAEDLTVTDGYDRTLKVTLHHSDNTGDTGVINGENLEIDRVYIIDLNEVDGNLKIANLTVG